MRALLLLLALAAAFGLAALWQSRHLQGLRERREVAAMVADGAFAETSSGLVPAGRAVMTLGVPSGAPPLEGEPAEDVADVGRFQPPDLPDFELTVQPGQTLSQICEAHYGTSNRSLVGALAEYNGLADADALSVGDRLRLPELDKLQP
jgi:nucleoid-associated protein YgaU